MSLKLDDIPITNELKDFKSFLSTTDRVIFSAPFGDGKSTFLNEFKTSEEYSKGYAFFTIHPLNYQVAENRDIFEYIKRDILIQQLSYAEFPEAVYSDLLMGQMYLMNNFGNITSDAAKALPNLDLFGVPTAVIKSGFEFIHSNIRKFNDYKQKILKEHDTTKAETFLDSFESRDGFIYEFDFISQLICRINNHISISPDSDDSKVRTVLIIEDLDRMDPAHIFRILNILSAHIDRPHMGTTETASKQIENKFAFDKIILVCHYDNIRSIFHHFYGKETDFNGYISKFSSNALFGFSLRKSFKAYLYAKVGKDLQEYPNIINIIADLILTANSNDSYSLRDIANKVANIHNSSFITTDYLPVCGDYKIRGLNPLTKILLLLAQFDIQYEKFLESIPSKMLPEYHNLVGVCWFVDIKETNVRYSSDGVFSWNVKSSSTYFDFPSTIDSDNIITSKTNRGWETSIYAKEIASVLPSIIKYLQHYICIKNNRSNLDVNEGNPFQINR